MTIPLMQKEPILPPGEMLRQAMRKWVTGVAVVTSFSGEVIHGMTVNSFVSISLDPPLVTVTMNKNTRTYNLVENSGVFAVTVLSHLQQDVAEIFAGRVLDREGHEPADRFLGLDFFTMRTGAPLLAGGMAFIDCRVVYKYPLLHSTLFIGEVLEARNTSLGPNGETLMPLVYFNRTFAMLS